MEQNEEQLYTISDISRKFNIPESTCRYYCKRFSEYIPIVGEGRKKRFRQETINVMETIVEEMKKSRTCDAVEEILAIRFPRTALVVSQNHDNTNLSIRQSVKENTVEQCHDQISTVEKNNLEISQNLPPLVIEFMERQTLALEGIAKMFNSLLIHLNNITNNNVKNDEYVDIKHEITKMKSLIDANEQTQQADMEQIRAWIGRIMKKLCHSS
ncbi:MAG: MerR family transcriptional regulator [Desulfovibrionaceae bacterium]|nr:MerR family transcriptional regulator [Desulfovibrionaceae bacterium]